ncbi:T9SS type A sorting domain-containing protein [Salegentibacter sp. BLCTC]|uniref:choice-of-anchor Q domain-containing protein n=1 Tax=Salegentibacter sp. BLCTC TaxID=2697368 RepID=UPI00187B3A54|nr:choice-of-anchor Q domain-containing protein [Salegentibacter sp. BLCTC]MBE7641096.1 T9SS type A sorting domain-containing protein [Salegentibacter sp. BLCTC]
MECDTTLRNKRPWFFFLSIILTGGIYGQTLNFDMDDAILYDSNDAIISGENDPGEYIYQSVTSGADTYTVQVRHANYTDRTLLTDLGGGNEVFYFQAGGDTNPWVISFTKNGNPTDFTLNSIRYYAYNNDKISLVNQDNNIISAANAYGAGANGTVNITNTANATDISSFKILPETSITLNNYGFDNINVSFPSTGLTPYTPDVNNILYVDKNVSGGNGNGSNWTNAVPELADALLWAANDWDGSGAPLQIWVAEGVYYPDEGDRQTNNDRNATFQLITGVEIYGGFEGNESNSNDRNLEENITILSGDIDGNDTTNSSGIVTDPSNISGANSYSVVTGSGTNNTARLDGFIITAGSADVDGGGAHRDKGGGMYNLNGDPTLTNITFSGNSALNTGGGMYNYDSFPVLLNVSFSHNNAGDGGGGGMFNRYSSPTLTDVIFRGNSTSFPGGGGGMHNSYESSPVLTNTTFSGNTATSGGGMYNFVDSSPVLTNAIFTDNNASNYGGGMMNDNESDPMLTGVTFTGNNATHDGGAIYSSSQSNLTLTNVIIWQNQADGNSSTTSASIYNTNLASANISFSLIANSGGSGLDWDNAIGTDNNNNIDADPQFVNRSDPNGLDNIFGTNDDGLTLEATSPAINAGDNSAIPSGLTTDLAGNNRIFNLDVVDMGAYEYQGEKEEPISPDENKILYVKKGGAGNQSGDSWSNAIPELREALNWAVGNWSTEDGNLQVWVAEGTYLPTSETTPFRLIENLSLIGGFEGTEEDPSERDISGHPSILSGDVNESGTADAGDAHIIVLIPGITNGVTIDGFIFESGYADGGSTGDRTGAAIDNNGSNTILNSIFRDNHAVGNASNGIGGAVISFGGELSFINTLFYNNTSTSGGGAISAENGTVRFINSTLANNESPKGGAINIWAGNVIAINSIFYNNSGTNGNMNDDGGSGMGSAEHSLFFNETAGNTGDIPDGITDGGNNLFNTNPVFTNEENGNYSLLNTSSAINAGSNSYFGMGEPAEGIIIDLAGNDRIYNSGTVDMGVYEFQGEPIIVPTPDEDNILYVNKNVSSGNGSGDSWENAIPQLEDALFWSSQTNDPAWATTPLQIWVAEGIYYPDEGRNSMDNDRNTTFQLITGVQIYGGFQGNEDKLSDRDWQGNETILSGNIDGDNTITGNSYHVVNGTGADNTAILDGFTITGGNADSSYPDNGGGGVFINNSSQSSSPRLSHLQIVKNEADNIGGGIYSYNSSFTLFNVEVSENKASYGGGIYLTVGHPKLLNVGIYGNSARRDGGGINNTDEITLTNVSIYSNSSGGDGGGLYNTGDTNIQNSILWGNTAGGTGNQIHTDAFYGSVPIYTNSLVQDNDLTGTGIGNLDGSAYTSEMIFANFSSGDYTLAAGSSAINAGGNQVYTDAGGDLQNDKDLAGSSRLDAVIIDLGAYELQGASIPPTPNGGTLYVNKNVSGGNGSGDSWVNAIPELADALKWAHQEHQIGTPWSESNPLEIWVAKGTYHPDAGDRATNNDRNETFQLISGVRVYGGFEGVEDNLTDRDWQEHITVLSGDIEGNDASDSNEIVVDPVNISGANSYTVVTGSDADDTAILDGFTITAGSADDESVDTDAPERNGGGIYNYEGSPTLTNLIITGNITEYRGGGVFNFNSSPVLTNVNIEGNRTIVGSSSGHYGGGIANISGSFAVLINSKIVGNSAQAGGGVYNEGSPTTIINTLIVQNTAISSNGGGIFNFLSTPTELINVTISGNDAGNLGGGVFNAFASLNLKNTIVWGNTADSGNEIATQTVPVILQNSLYGNNTGDIVGNLSATLTLNDEPQFKSVDQQDYSLKANSPAINKGDNNLYPGDLNIDLDLAGNPRLFNSTIDIGAFESQNAPPTAICQDITVNLNANGEVNITAADIDKGSSDIEGDVTLSIDITSFDCDDIGKNTVILSVEDEDGSTATCEAIVTIKDNLAPVPGTPTLDDFTAECEVLESDIATPLVTDNCSGTVTITNDVTFPITSPGTTVITWTYEDENENISTQTQNVIIEDVIAPVADQTILADITTECEVLAGDVPTPGATDNCGKVVKVTNDATFPITRQGTTVITWTYEDENGNTSTQTQNVIIEDVTAPVADQTILADITAECEVLASDVPTPGATDNCGGTVMVTHDATFPITRQGTTVITWTYEDENGNTSTQTQNVIIEDVTAPVADQTILADITAECEVLAGDVPTPGATDNCGEVVKVTNDATFPITTQGTTVITWTYEDENGNTSTQTQNVIIKDVTAPIVDETILADITAECEVLAGDVPTPGATDNCGEVVKVTNDATFPISTQGTTVITWTYEDENGNISMQTQNLIIEDITAPVADQTTLVDITSECEVLASDVPTPDATDNCGGTVMVTHDATFPITSPGTTVITWTYEDENGNISTQTQNVIIKDVTAPVADQTILADITSECEVLASDVPTPDATDNCGGTVMVTHDATFPITSPGTTVITWTYEDENGNTSTQTQNVIINDSPLTQVIFEDQTFVYDGAVKGLEVVNLPEGTTVSYTNNEQLDAGVYEVTAFITSANTSCQDQTLTAKLTIEKAPQEINFDEISDRNQYTDDNFQLEATSSSGLPIIYSYTYNTENPPATVGPRGFVQILNRGEITITARQEGNENYKPATPIVRVLRIIGGEARLNNVAINNIMYPNPDAEVYHLMVCGNDKNEVHIELEPSLGAFTDKGNEFIMATPIPGIYRETVRVTSEDGNITKTYTIIIEKRFSFDDIIVQKFNNVLLVNNNPETNGGYKFVKYRWYKNGSVIGHNQYYSAGNDLVDQLDPDSDYYVEMETEDGEILKTCIAKVQLRSSYNITLTPNPVRSGGAMELFVDFPKEELKTMELSIHNLNGVFLKNLKANSKTTRISIPYNLQIGVYLLRIKTRNINKTLKFIVK